jgi:hypothetical protein
MSVLGNGLIDSEQYEDALSVQEAELDTARRIGAPERHLLTVQANLANTYGRLGREEEALNMLRDVYSGRLKLDGAEHPITLQAANNYAGSLVNLRRFEEAKALLLKTMPVARRVLGQSHDVTLGMRKIYGEVLCRADGAMLDDLREAVTTLEDTIRIRRRVFGGSHPKTEIIERTLRNARAVLRARETPSASA